jgi:hypothetical protein
MVLAGEQLFGSEQLVQNIAATTSDFPVPGGPVTTDTGSVTIHDGLTLADAEPRLRS